MTLRASASIPSIHTTRWANEMRRDQRGSIWRKWDFHFHTQSSFDHDYKSGSDDDLVATLLNANVSAVVVSDHHKIDAGRIRSLQALAADKLVVFPGIELRSELGGGESVHFIGIFPEDSDLDELWDILKVKLGISAKQVAEKTDEWVYVPFVKGAEAIHDLGGLVTVHAGNKSNSIERIRNIEKFKQAVKTDLVRDHVDIFELGSTKDVDGYCEKVFPSLGFSRPLVLGSDNHDFREYGERETCWIKADVTFHGLRHILHESDGRIHLGPEPPSITRVNGNRTRYMRRLTLTKRSESTLREDWFNSDITLNHGLVAIIGNKGSGKSALADILGLLGDSPHGDSFSFLNSEKFKQPKENKAQHFEARLEWESGGDVTKSLDDDVEGSSLESVKYVPQAYLEKVCNELGTGAASRFSQELKAVIFSHIGTAERLDYDDLDSLIGYRTKETEAAITLLRSDLQTAVQKVVRLEERLTDNHRKTLKNQLEMKQRELASHEANRPAKVEKPEAAEGQSEKVTKLVERMTKLKEELSSKDEEIKQLNVERSKLTKKIAAADTLLARIVNFQSQHTSFKEESTSDCAVLGLDLDALVKIQINTKPIELAKDAAAAELSVITDKMSEKDPNSVPAKRKAIIKQIESSQAELDKPQQEYQNCLQAVEAWDKRKAAIVGDADTPETLKYLETQFDGLKSLPEQLATVRATCVTASSAIFEKIRTLADDYRKVYQPVQQFIQDHRLARNKFDMQFEAAIIPTDFETGFLRLISRGKRGTFCGQEDGAKRIRQLVSEADFNSWEGVSDFLATLEQQLLEDHRQEPPQPVPLSGQLRKGVTPGDVYEYIYSLDYLKPHYTLRWAGKDIGQLSPGERGTLLLVFYLLIDRSEVPLVIDQPEENLDNQTVYDTLVPAIKEAKDRRQIIVVTHNPNLAVVCDAEQIIHASLDKDQNNRVTYTSGAIENPDINQKVIDVLEGTRPAFDNRGMKYHEAVK